MPITKREIGDAVEYTMGIEIRMIAESCWKVARRECRKEIQQVIERLASETSLTGHGKAQRAFARKVLSVLSGGADS